MKILVFVSCVCLAQLCLSKQLKSKEDIRSYLKDAGEPFVDDLAEIFKTFQGSHFVSELGGEIVELLYKKVPKERGGKIVVQDVKDYLVKLQENFTQSSGKQQRLTDALNRFETTLSTQLPPERYNRIMNLVRVFSNLDATSEEIQSCLDYVYGTQSNP